MNAKILVNIGALLMVAWIVLGKPGLDGGGGVTPAPDLPPLVVPADAPQLDAIFAGTAGADRDLTYMVALLDRLATYIERDGMAPEPRIKHGANVQDLRAQMRHDLFDGATLTAKYPAFGPTVGAYLDGKLGTIPADLAGDVRGKWVAAFRAIAASCERARRALP